MALPPVPEQLHLHIEEAPDRIRIAWPVRAGELRRKIVVGISVLCIAGLAYLIYDGFYQLPSRRHPSWLILWLGFIAGSGLLVFIPALGMGVNILLQSKESGDAALTLTRTSIRYAPGAGHPPISIARKNLLTPFHRVGFSGIEWTALNRLSLQALPNLLLAPLLLFSRRRTSRFIAPGEAEAAWLAEVLARWQADTLFTG